MTGQMASNWIRRGVGRGVRTRGGFGRGIGIERRYIRSDYNMFSRLAGPNTQSDTEGETSDTEGMMTDTNDDGYITVESKRAKAKRRPISSGGRSEDIHETDSVPEHELEEDTDFDSLSTNAKLSVILAKLSLNQGKVESIESMLFSVVKKQKRISNIETVVRSHDSRLRLL